MEVYDCIVYYLLISEHVVELKSADSHLTLGRIAGIEVVDVLQVDEDQVVMPAEKVVKLFDLLSLKFLFLIVG